MRLHKHYGSVETVGSDIIGNGGSNSNGGRKEASRQGESDDKHKQEKQKGENNEY
jgi:hypothetical protein